MFFSKVKFCYFYEYNRYDSLGWRKREGKLMRIIILKAWDGKSASNDIFLAARSRLSAGKNRARAYERFVTFSKTTSRPGSPTFSHLRASILGVRLHMHGMLLLTDKHPWRSKRSKADQLPFHGAFYEFFLRMIFDSIQIASEISGMLEFFILSLSRECIINRINHSILSSFLWILLWIFQLEFSFFRMKKFQS